ncbi:MAG: ABC transporter ATP-binding protein [Pseudomonadota bacterium]|nr:ABC transporter ATP-binding protein [Pseudomonadota bacterium]
MSAAIARLSLEHFTVQYLHAERPALSDISFGLRAGACLGVVGESGSGKSTLALALIGLLPGSARQTGSLHCEGGRVAFKDVRAWRALRGHHIGYVFQDAAASLHPLRSVYAQLHEMLRDDARVLAALHEVGLATDRNFLRRQPHQLSGGQRQRLMIALALALAPPILICDEPSSALDALASAAILDLLQRLKLERGLALLFVSHDLDAVAAIADELLVLRAGICELQGATASVLASDQAYVSELRNSRPRLRGNPQRLGAGDATPLPRPAAGPVVIEVAKLQARYQDRLALSDLAFVLRRGQTLGVMGASGSGKSTLARVLLALQAPAQGRMQVAGADPRQLRGRALKQWRRRVQIVFQDPGTALDPQQRVGEAIGEALDLHRLVASASERTARITQLLADVRLSSELIDRYPHQLSGGQKQRVAIARALATDPEVLICDEAVSALDVSVQAEVLNLLADLRDQRQLSLIFIGHDLAAMSFISDQLLVLDQGRIVEAGATADVLGDPQHAVTRALIAALPPRLRAST